MLTPVAVALRVSVTCRATASADLGPQDRHHFVVERADEGAGDGEFPAGQTPRAGLLAVPGARGGADAGAQHDGRPDGALAVAEPQRQRRGRAGAAAVLQAVGEQLAARTFLGVRDASFHQQSQGQHEPPTLEHPVVDGCQRLRTDQQVAERVLPARDALHQERPAPVGRHRHLHRLRSLPGPDRPQRAPQLRRAGECAVRLARACVGGQDAALVVQQPHGRIEFEAEVGQDRGGVLADQDEVDELLLEPQRPGQELALPAQALREGGGLAVAGRLCLLQARDVQRCRGLGAEQLNERQIAGNRPSRACCQQEAQEVVGQAQGDRQNLLHARATQGVRGGDDVETARPVSSERAADVVETGGDPRRQRPATAEVALQAQGLVGPVVVPGDRGERDARQRGQPARGEVGDLLRISHGMHEGAQQTDRVEPRDHRAGRVGLPRGVRELQAGSHGTSRPAFSHRGRGL